MKQAETTTSFSYKIFVFLVCFFANLTVTFEAYGTSLASDLITGYFGVDQNYGTWILGAFLIGMACAIPTIAYLRGRYSDDKIYRVSLLILSICSFTSLFIQSFEMFTIVRFFCGFFGSLVVNLTIKLLQTIVDERSKNLIRSYGVFVFFLNLGVASLICGFIYKLYFWKLVFFLEGICALLMSNLIKKIKFLPRAIQFRILDFKGFIFFCLFVFLSRTYFSQAKAAWNTLGWSSDFSFIVLGLTLFSFYQLIHASFKENGVFDFTLFKNPRFVLACFIGVMIRSNVFGPQIHLIDLLYKAFLYEFDRVGILLFIYGLSIFISGMIFSFLGGLKKISHINIAFTSISLMAMDSFLTHSLTIISSLFDIGFILVIKGCSIGFALYALDLYLQDIIAAEGREKAITLNQSVGAYTTAISSAVLGAIIVTRMAYHSLIFGEQVNEASAAYKNYMSEYIEVFKENSIDHMQAIDQAKSYLIDYIQRQSYIASYDDAVFIYGLVNVFGLCLILLDFYFVKRRKEKQA
jgi:DHA2 family multidrug resistance protein